MGANFGANFIYMMINSKPSISVILDKRRIKKGSLFPVKFSIYFDNYKKKYNSGIDLTESDWNKLWNNNLREDVLKRKRRIIEGKRFELEEIINKLNPFSFQEFESFLFKEKAIPKSSYLIDLFEMYISKLNSEDRVGTAISYRTTLNSLLAFKGNKKISEINLNYLKEYEKQLLINGKSPSTAGIYLRQLRRIINLSIQDGLLPASKYPFRGFPIPTSRNIKKALNENELRKLLCYTPDSAKSKLALDFWIFSYLCNGMNMTDICLLKKNNIQDGFLYFYRAKTKNTKKKDLRPIKVPLLPRAISIIESWRNLDNFNSYLFPILNDSLNSRQIKFKIQGFVKLINTQMKFIGNELDINAPLGTYVARHTHSTILMRKGVSTEMIKSNLGHSSVAVTEAYLGDFTDEHKMEIALKLLEF